VAQEAKIGSRASKYPYEVEDARPSIDLQLTMENFSQAAKDSSSRRQLDKQQVRNAAREFEFEASKYPYEEEDTRPANYSPMKATSVAAEEFGHKPCSKKRRIGSVEPAKEFPEGLPAVDGQDRLRLQKANSIYQHIPDFLSKCQGDSVWWSCDNPESSYLWFTTWFRRLSSLHGVSEVSFHQCMHGGKRKTSSEWLSNIPELGQLSLRCDGSHAHLPFGGRFCSGKFAFANIVTNKVAACGILLPPKPAKAAHSASLPQLRANAGRQPRGRRFPELIPEFKEVVTRAIATKDIAKWA
jgi:hypothetical protein